MDLHRGAVPGESRLSFPPDFPQRFRASAGIRRDGFKRGFPPPIQYRHAAVFGLCLGLAATASADIGINFHYSGSGGLAPSAVAGVIPRSGWNNIDVGDAGAFSGAPFGSTSLSNADGSPSGASISTTLASGYNGASGSGTATADRQMFGEYISWDQVGDGDDKEDSGNIRVSGLGAEFTDGGYDVILYFDSNAADRIFTFTVAGESITGKDAATFSGTFAEAAGSNASNYARFRGLTAPGFTIDANSNTGRAALNGLQIIPSSALPAIQSFSAGDLYIQPGEKVTLSWACQYAAALAIDNGVGDVLPLTVGGRGSIELSPPQTTTYVLTATNGSSTATARVTVSVGPKRPNLVVLLVDDMGPQDTSVPFMLDGGGNPVRYGFNNFYKTPNMETLAERGVRFTTAYGQSVCSPTRCGLMTGRNSARHGVTDYLNATAAGAPTNWRSNGLDTGDATLPALLKTGGYRTIHVGKAHFCEPPTKPEDLGFDINIAGSDWGQPNYGYIGTPAYGGMPGMETYDGSIFLTRALSIEANRQIEKAVADGVPFYLNMDFYAVHTPLTTNPDATGDYSGALNSDHRKFATMIEGVDIAIGAIRQKLVDLGVAGDTIILFLGDNGTDSPATTQDGLPSGTFGDWPMRGKKGSKWEGGTRVPLIACWAAPDAASTFQQTVPISPGSIETDIVTTWDLPVTMLDLAGLPGAEGFGEDGHSLLPYLEGTPGTHRPQEVIIHYPHDHRSDFFTWVRQGSLKLIYNFKTNTHQLYDLATDPTESIDLASSRPETVMRMARELARELEKTWGPAGPLIPTTTTVAPAGNAVSIPSLPAVDLDADGLSDNAEDPNSNGLVDGGETDPDNRDTDSDTYSDGSEIKTGTNPLDSSSYFLLRLICVSDTESILMWPSAPGATYALQTSTTLREWTTEIDNLPASESGAWTSVPRSFPDGNLFYRVQLK